MQEHVCRLWPKRRHPDLLTVLFLCIQIERPRKVTPSSFGAVQERRPHVHLASIFWRALPLARPRGADASMFFNRSSRDRTAAHGAVHRIPNGRPCSLSHKTCDVNSSRPITVFGHHCTQHGDEVWATNFEPESHTEEALTMT